MLLFPVLRIAVRTRGMIDGERNPTTTLQQPLRRVLAYDS